jgi:hypothetical protein
MNRRGFFSRIASAALAGVILPREAEVWLFDKDVEKVVIEPPYNALVFHKNAFTLIYPPLDLPFAAQPAQPETGLSVRYVHHASASDVRYEVRARFLSMEDPKPIDLSPVYDPYPGVIVHE